MENLKFWDVIFFFLELKVLVGFCFLNDELVNLLKVLVLLFSNRLEVFEEMKNRCEGD